MSPVRDTAEVAESVLMERAVRQHGEANERLVRSPVRLPLVPLAAERSGPRVLEDFGFTQEEIDALVEEGAVGDIEAGTATP